MANDIYRSEFTNDNDNDFVIDITNVYSPTQPGSGITDTFINDGKGFEYNQESEDDALIGLFPSSVNFTLIAQNNTEYTTINSIFARSDETWWVIIYKDEVLWWEGLLTLLPTSYDYSTGVQRFNFTAYDLIASLKDRKVWEQWPGLYGVDTFRTDGFTFTAYPAIHHGFGWRNGGTPAIGSNNQIFNHNFSHNGQNYTKAFGFDPFLNFDTYLTGYIYGLLYDLVIDKVGEKSITVAMWDHTSGGAAGNSTNTLAAISSLDLCPNMLYDPTKMVIKSTGPLSFQIYLETLEDQDCYEMLNEYVKFMRGRLFQKDGQYHFIQTECYTKTTAINTTIKGNDTGATVPDGTRYNIARHGVGGSIDTVDYVVDLTAPRSEGMQGVNVEVLEPVRKVVLDISDRINGHENKTRQIVNGGGVSNFNNQRAKVHEFEVKSFGSKDIFKGGLVDRVYNGVGNFDELRNHYVTFIAQAFNTHREKINAALVETDYNQLKAIDFNGKRYLPTRLKYNANDNIWEGEWVEFTLDNTNVGEPTS